MCKLILLIWLVLPLEIKKEIFFLSDTKCTFRYEMQLSFQLVLRNLHSIRLQLQDFFGLKLSYYMGWQVNVPPLLRQRHSSDSRISVTCWQNLASLTIELSFAKALVGFSFWRFPSLVILLIWFWYSRSEFRGRIVLRPLIDRFQKPDLIISSTPVLCSSSGWSFLEWIHIGIIIVH